MKISSSEKIDPELLQFQQGAKKRTEVERRTRCEGSSIVEGFIRVLRHDGPHLQRGLVPCPGCQDCQRKH